MILIGERINSSRFTISQAIENRNFALIEKEATSQANAGADYIDVNAGTFYRDEGEKLAWLVRTVQAVTDKPLCIDTADSNALLCGLKEHRGRALVNSVTVQKERLEAFLPILKRYNCRVVGMCLNDFGVPETVEGRVKLATSLIDILRTEGIAPQDIFIDPVVHALSTDQKAAWATLETAKAIQERHPEVLTICGVSNVSFGLPGRRKLNQVFLALAINAGIGAAILDPTDSEMISALKSAQVLLGKDDFCIDYISQFRK